MRVPVDREPQLDRLADEIAAATGMRPGLALTWQRQAGRGEVDVFADADEQVVAQVIGGHRPPAAPSCPCGGHLPQVVRSNVLHAATLDVHTVAKVVLYTVAVETVDGEMVEVHARAQATNDLGYNVMWGLQIVRASEATAVKGASVMRATAVNITPDVHHFPRLGYGVDFPPAGVHHYNVVGYAASTASTAEGATITVDDYGEAIAKVWKQ